MENIKVISNFGLDFKMEVPKPCELYVDKIPNNHSDCKRILWVIEPNEVSRMTNNIISNHNKFDLILTYDSNILNDCKNAELFPYGTSWIKDFDFSQEKKFVITTLVGGKKMCSNHPLRHQLVDKSKEIKSIGVDIFNSINNPFQHIQGHKQMKSKLWKNEMFYSQFHIAIENTTMDNWFTEKLIDCFQTKTVPIYIGCENIGDFFDINGILHVKNLDELVDVCNNINENTYKSMETYIEKNYELSFKYSDYKKSLTNKINEFLN